MSARRWWFHWPGMVYAGNVYAGNESSARSRVRSMYNMRRLPNGVAFWEG